MKSNKKKMHFRIRNRCICGILMIAVLPISGVAQLNSAGTYVWHATDLPRVFNHQLQLSFVNAATGFPSFGTLIAGGGYSISQDGGVFQLYIPYGSTLGGVAPQIRFGLYNNLGWSNWSTFYTSANANNPATDWSARNLVSYGNILVGKTSQQNTAYRVDVNGDIRANRVVVNTTGADFVFDSSYNLLPINSLSSFITAHHHLPGVPNSQELRAHGISLGEGYSELLEKIEILTQYVINQNNIIKALKKRIETLDYELQQVKQKTSGHSVP